MPEIAALRDPLEVYRRQVCGPKLRGGCSPEAVATVNEALGPIAALWPDAPRVAGAAMTMAISLCGVAEQGLSVSQSGGWSSFVHAALPRWTRTSRGKAGFTLVADYGGVDVFLVRVERGDLLWKVTTIEWWRLSIATHRARVQHRADETDAAPLGEEHHRNR